MLQVFSRKRAINFRALLRKMNYNDKVSYNSTPPCSELMNRFINSPHNQVINPPHNELMHATHIQTHIQTHISHTRMTCIPSPHHFCVTYTCCMAHIVTHMCASRHTSECFMTHTQMNHDTHMNESCHTHEEHDSRGTTLVVVGRQHVYSTVPFSSFRLTAHELLHSHFDLHHFTDWYCRWLWLCSERREVGSRGEVELGGGTTRRWIDSGKERDRDGRGRESRPLGK